MKKGRVTIPTNLDVVPQTLEILDEWGRYRERKNRNCTCGESGISKDAVNIRHTGKRCGYPGSVHGIPADWLMMVPGR